MTKEELKSDPLLIKNPFMMNSKVGEVRFGVGANKPENMARGLSPKLPISTDPLDYEIPPEVLNKNSKVKHHQGLPISFLQIKTEEEGVEWYKQHYPQIPDDLLPVIARYHWGEPMTKKGLKNERKKIIKKAEKQGIQVKKGGFVVKFE